MYDCSTRNICVYCSSVQVYRYIAFVMIYMGLGVFDALGFLVNIWAAGAQFMD